MASESLPDPKQSLHEALRIASGRQGRRLKQFAIPHATRRVAEFIDDFAPLRELSAFYSLEADIRQIIARQGWISLNESSQQHK